MTWYHSSNPYTRRVVAFLAIVVVLFQVRGSLKALQGYTLSGEAVSISPEGSLSDGAPSKQLRNSTLDFLEKRLLPNANERLTAANASAIDGAERVEDKIPDQADSKIEAPQPQQSNTEAPVRQQSNTEAPQSQQSNTEAPVRQQFKTKSGKPLNIVVLYPDDWRHDDIGGVAPVVRTPFLNKLAREGIRFTHNMVTTSICWISRATLFTGQYASRHKSYRLKTPEFYKTWHNTSWPALLQQQAGYYTGHVGKWQYWGFEEKLFNFSSIFEGKHQYAHNGKVIPAAEKTYLEVKNFLDKRPKDKPFAVTAAFYPPKAIGNSFVPGGQWFPQNKTRMTYENETIPHPYNETDSYKRLPKFFHRVERGGRSRWEERFEGEERYQAAMKNYYSLITEVDEACRNIVQELENQGVLDETLIIFTTDNGLLHAEHGLAGKWYPYQESIRVPLIIRDPRMPEENHDTLDGSLTLNIDLHPTILGAAGVTPPPGTQGRDMADLYLPKEEVNNAEEWRDEFFYEFPIDNGKTMPMSTAVVRKDIKYIYWPQFRYEQLFNLTQDPLELTDVWNEPQYAQVLKELQTRHDELIEAVK